MISPFPTRCAATYVAPLREGGSLPAVVEDTDGDLWVVKFRGAGQGPKALVAELIGGRLAELLGLPTPGLAIVELDETFGQGERDPEIRDVLKGSIGPNVGLRYLDGAFNLDPVAAGDRIEPETAARVVWLDALLINPDRTARNPNLMVHDGALWLIDHGAALFDHHDWSRVDAEKTRRPFPMSKDHVLLSSASSISAVDAGSVEALTAEVIDEMLAGIPAGLLVEPAPAIRAPEPPETTRARYKDWLTARLEGPRSWVEEAERARLALVPPDRLEARR